VSAAVRRLPSWTWALALAVLAAVAAVALVSEAERRLPRGHALEELAYYPSGRWLVPASLGERALLADLTWLRAVQYYGEHRLTDNKFSLLYHVFDIVTTLDPGHRNSYVFGGTSLAQEGRQFAHGIALLEKGRAHDPTEWVYPFEIGFLYFVQKRDYAAATAWFRESARKPNAPEYVTRFAAFTAGRAGARPLAMELWQRVAEETDNPVLRAKATGEAIRLARGTPDEATVRHWAKHIGGVGE
jgi:tetratricopeptide (TPR) repeat protein